MVSQTNFPKLINRLLNETHKSLNINFVTLSSVRLIHFHFVLYLWKTNEIQRAGQRFFHKKNGKVKCFWPLEATYLFFACHRSLPSNTCNFLTFDLSKSTSFCFVCVCLCICWLLKHLCPSLFYLQSCISFSFTLLVFLVNDRQ